MLQIHSSHVLAILQNLNAKNGKSSNKEIVLTFSHLTLRSQWLSYSKIRKFEIKGWLPDGMLANSHCTTSISGSHILYQHINVQYFHTKLQQSQNKFAFLIHLHTPQHDVHTGATDGKNDRHLTGAPSLANDAGHGILRLLKRDLLFVSSCL